MTAFHQKGDANVGRTYRSASSAAKATHYSGKCNIIA